MIVPGQLDIHSAMQSMQVHLTESIFIMNYEIYHYIRLSRPAYDILSELEHDT